MSGLGFIKALDAEVEILPYRVVSFGSTEGSCTLGTNGNEPIGVSGVQGAKIGQRLDVYLSEIQEVECAGDVAYGDWLGVSDDGRVVAATTGKVIGRSWSWGSAGSRVGALLNPTVLPA